jgi:hypothetical protein
LFTKDLGRTAGSHPQPVPQECLGHGSGDVQLRVAGEKIGADPELSLCFFRGKTMQWEDPTGKIQEGDPNAVAREIFIGRSSF